MFKSKIIFFAFLGSAIFSTQSNAFQINDVRKVGEYSARVKELMDCHRGILYENNRLNVALLVDIIKTDPALSEMNANGYMHNLDLSDLDLEYYANDDQSNDVDMPDLIEDQYEALWAICEDIISPQGQNYLYGADLTGLNFRNSKFWIYCDYAKLDGADFSNRNCVLESFVYASLKGANFNNSDMCGVNFTNADLTDSSFNDAFTDTSMLSGPLDFTNAICDGMKFGNFFNNLETALIVIGTSSENATYTDFNGEEQYLDMAYLEGIGGKIVFENPNGINFWNTELLIAYLNEVDPLSDDSDFGSQMEE